MLTVNTKPTLIPDNPFQACTCTANEFMDKINDIVEKNPDLLDFLYSNTSAYDALSTGKIITTLIDCTIDDDGVQQIDMEPLQNSIIQFGTVWDNPVYQFHTIVHNDVSTTVLMAFSHRGQYSEDLNDDVQSIVFAYFKPDGRLSFYVPVYGNTVFPDSGIAFLNYNDMELYDASIPQQLVNLKNSIILPQVYQGFPVNQMDAYTQDFLKLLLAYQTLYGVIVTPTPSLHVPHSSWINSDLELSWMNDTHPDIDRTLQDITANICII